MLQRSKQAIASLCSSLSHSKRRNGGNVCFPPEACEGRIRDFHWARYLKSSTQPPCLLIVHVIPLFVQPLDGCLQVENVCHFFALAQARLSAALLPFVVLKGQALALAY